ncbi:MAG: aspartate aminotransferase family protein [Pseudomonadota bacterium]
MNPTDAGTNAPHHLQDYIDRGLQHLWVHTQSIDELRKDDQFLVIESGDGIYLKDSAGRTYIDAMSGLWVVAAGHGRKELVDAAARQMEQLSYANPFAYATPSAIDLATKLSTVTPTSVNRFYFVNTGAEAVETAIRMAKQYHYNRGQAGRFKVISRMGSYHGMTHGALSVNGGGIINRAPFEPLLPGNIPVPNTQGPGGLSNDKTGLDDGFWADFIEEMVKFHRPETIAAFIAEPISTANGNYLPSPAYWTRIRDICDRYDIVLIADEVINGFGRTGKWFGIDHFPIEPDLMTVAKGLSSGYAPIAAVMASDKISAAFEGGPEKAFIGGSTFGAHPVSCAVALENVNILEREGLVANAAEVGAHLEGLLSDLVSRRRIVGRTRGVGLMHQIDLVKDPDTGTGFDASDDLSRRVPAALRAHGLLARGRDNIQVAPPLVITKIEAENLVDRLDATAQTLEKELGL